MTPRFAPAVAFSVAALAAWSARAEPPTASLPPVPDESSAPPAPPPPAPPSSSAAPTQPDAPAPAPAQPSVPPNAPAATSAPPAATAPPAAPAPSVTPGQLAHAMRPPTTAFVHIFSTHPGAILELRSFVDEDEWRPACRAPCDAMLHVEGTEARVVAPGMSASNAFRIEPGHGAARFRVSGGTESSRRLGTIALIAGIPLTLAGMGIWGYGRLEDKSGLQTVGAITLGAGAVAVLGSLPFLAAGRTSVKDAKGKVIAQRRWSLPPM